ncbi:MAG: deoxycytidyl transferase [Pycnora praestabilis]|nr:MAG: deoxycytidyl transferase [Pycnora praestabilis]
MASRLHASDANSTAVRKRIENHTFEDEEGEEYKASRFGGFTDYFRRKKIKLQNLDSELRSSSASNAAIFKGVVAHVNGYTQPSLNDLHKLVVTHGGGFLQYLDGKTTVTHIIASNLTPKKKVEFRRYRIVKPAWIVESVNAGKLLPWDSFRVLDEGAGQKVLGFDNGQVISQANDQQRGYRDQTDTSWYTSQIKHVVDELHGSDEDKPLPSTQLPPHSEEYEAFSAPPSHQPEAVEPKQEKNEHERECSPISFNATPNASLPSTEEENFAEDRIKLLVDSPSGEMEHHEPDLNDEFSFRPAVEGENTTGSWMTDNEIRPIDTLERSLTAPLTPNVQRSDSTTSMSPSKTMKLTAEEHNAVLLADPRIRKSTVVHPDFLRQYYQESRLHHLSTWKADLKNQLQQLTAEKSGSQKALQKRVAGSRRYILHVDFDSFFCAVSLKNAPQYVDKPAVVAHGGGSGSEIASCNYPARKFGVKNGMWMKYAQQLCPELKVLPYDFKAYEAASRGFYDAILATGGIVQSVSVDEALVDVSTLCSSAGGSGGKGVHEGSIWREQAKADEIGRSIRDVVKEKTGCAVSVGIGTNILLAKLALRKAKPAGQHQIKPEDTLEFIGGLTVQDLPGVAYSIGGKLEEIGVKFVKDIRDLSKERLVTTLGPKTGEKIWDYARGIDRTEVGEQVTRKSVSAEVNWGVRFETQAQAEEFVQNLCGELHRRLIEQKVKGRQLTMKLMRRTADAPLDPPKHLGHGKCDTFNKSLVLGIATNAQEILSREAVSIMRGFGFSPGELRGIGVQMTKLEPVKGIVNGEVQSSQKRLQFQTKDSTYSMKAETEDPIVDDVDSPRKPNTSQFNYATTNSPLVGRDTKHKPLNTLGTQFILPTQIDPDVLAELPEDIRSRFLITQEPKSQSPSRPQTPDEHSRSQSPSVPLDALPAQSQIDQETLDALPEDVKAEILAFYHKSPRKINGQSLLPQSPRKVRSLAPSNRKLTTPTKKRGGLLSRGRGLSKGDSVSTLTQSNFVSNRISNSKAKGADLETGKDQPQGSEEISSDFLAALPEDIRREVIAQQRRDRLKRCGGLDLAATRKKNQRHQQLQAPQVQRRLRLPPRPERPSFTTKKLSALPELRDMVYAWHEEFLEEGPYAEDVEALVKYLCRVVGEERDLSKAVAVVKWMDWVIDQGAGPEKGQEVWKDALGVLQDGVQQAITARGLGKVEF